MANFVLTAFKKIYRHYFPKKIEGSLGNQPSAKGKCAYGSMNRLMIINIAKQKYTALPTSIKPIFKIGIFFP